MTNNEVSPTEKTVRTVLGVSYDAFGFADAPKFVAQIVDIIEDEAKRVPSDEMDGTSVASEEIRELLWNRYTGGGMSAIATCSLFCVLNRPEEVNSLALDVSYSAWQHARIMRLASERVGAEEWVQMVESYATATETS